MFVCRTDGYNRRDSRLTNRGRRSVSQHIRLQVCPHVVLRYELHLTLLTPTVALWVQL